VSISYPQPRGGGAATGGMSALAALGSIVHEACGGFMYEPEEDGWRMHDCPARKAAGGVTPE
jgi:hypothetical protein